MKPNWIFVIAFLVGIFGFCPTGFSEHGIPWPEVSTIEELKKLMEGEPTYVFIYSERCAATPYVVKRIKLYEKIFKYKIIAWKLEIDTKLPGTPYQIVSVPQLNFFNNNTRYDALFGWTATKKAEEKFLIDFLNRTSDSNSKRKFGKVADVIKKPSATRTQMLKKLGKFARFPFDLTHFDFSNLEINRNMAFTGSYLRGVKFHNSSLDRVSFSGGDLTGTDFSKAKLGRVFWGNTICPDGTRSTEHQMSCKDNLQIKKRTQQKKEKKSPQAAGITP